MEGAKQLAGDVRQKAGSLFEAQAKDPKVTDPKSLLPQTPKTGIKGAIETVLKDLLMVLVLLAV